MTRDRTDGSRRRVPLWLVLGVLAVGLVLVVVAVAAQVRAPQPPRSVGTIDPTPTSTPAPTASGDPSPAGAATQAAAADQPLGASRPVRITIPAIGVSSQVKPIGLAPDGTLAVPQPGPDENKAAWFTKSPTPGQPGPAIIEGHVDTTSGPSVFFELGKIRPGNRVQVTRADGVVAVFTVDAVRDYPKSSFPTDTVYGAKNLGQPQLRLITCSDFDAAIGHHTGNTVVFAHLTSTHRSP